MPDDYTLEVYGRNADELALEIERLHPWTYFCTFTFEYGVSESAAERGFFDWLTRVRKHYAVKVFPVVEFDTERVHLHVLVTGEAPAHYLANTWRLGTFKVVEPVRNVRGAAGYMTKNYPRRAHIIPTRSTFTYQDREDFAAALQARIQEHA